jgi:type III restriction enzyme
LIHLEELQHQRDALDAILKAFPALDNNDTIVTNYANPLIEHCGDENYFVDCKMETGTGKTYVYTRLMHELHKQKGIFKFIIIVPSLAIKEGTKNFIESDYAKQHFAKFFPNKRINLQMINAGDFSNKKHRTFPATLSEFCDGDQNNKNDIQCLALNTHMLNGKLFTSDEYDQTLIGSSSCPAEALSLTRPVVIIDEPHRIKRDSTAYRKIIDNLKPQSIIRFGATFPDITVGTGRNKTTRKDYYRNAPQFDLTAIDAFNNGLVKGVNINYPVLDGAVGDVKYKVKSCNTKQVVFVKVGDTRNTEWTVRVGENLSNVDTGFEADVTYEGGNSKKLSNELELSVGMELIPGTFALSYQELLIHQALDAHFEKEQENFFRDNDRPRVKTVSLFFIDSIRSYRDADGGDWLKQKFEDVLNVKVDELIAKFDSKTGYRESEYLDFLIASKLSLCTGGKQEVHAGYFSEDKGKGDEAVQKEIQDILGNKEKMLTFKDEEGNWNLRRFLFSKWTLREGWDNPNVFVICKLRTSGSEISKLQEVGRGLRLPVDEKGNRLSDEEHRLTYIIDYSEKDFAKKLIGEVNKDSRVVLDRTRITDEMLMIVCADDDAAKDAILIALDSKGIINRRNEFLSDVTIENPEHSGRVATHDGFEWFTILYPQVLQTNSVQSGKITELGSSQRPKTKLRVDNWKKIESLWDRVTRRYMLTFERLPADDLEAFVDSVLGEGIFENPTVGLITEATRTSKSGRDVILTQLTEVIRNTRIGKLEYDVFIKRLAKTTGLPVQLLHGKVWEYLESLASSGETKENVNLLLNETSLANFVKAFSKKFNDIFATKYDYSSLSFSAETSVRKRDGSWELEVPQGWLGKTPANDVGDDSRNLFEPPTAVDSEIEHSVEKLKVDQRISVFGKIPRKAIKVPTYTGGSTTPDFIYAVTADNNDTVVTDLCLLVETKAEDMRGAEVRATDAQSKLFNGIPGVQWELVTDANDVLRLLGGLVEGGGNDNGG